MALEQSNLNFRLCEEKDKKDIDEISTLTWEGDDYLSRVFYDWLQDGNFWVAVLDDKVIGTAKFSFFPDNVLWLEGLRVHPDFQSMGFGKVINRFAMIKLHEYREKYNIKYAEFSTYYTNYRSIFISMTNGFKLVDRFFNLTRKVDKKKKAEELKDLNMDFSNYDEFIPFGWHFAHNTKKAAQWIKTKVKLFKAGDLHFYRAEPYNDYSFFNKNDIVKAIPYMNYFAEEDQINIVIPIQWRNILDALIKNGFEFWDEPKAPNGYIFSLELQ
ncbi:GNAT family N-acetyltransferase [bacterium]|nr:GNAT family N-acetyltransferase [bacterium]